MINSTVISDSNKVLEIKDVFDYIAYSETKKDINEKKAKRYNNMSEGNITEHFKEIQDMILKNEIPILTKLLSETMFEAGYESFAGKYFGEISEKYGVIADNVLLNIYLKNMYSNQYLLKHLLFIVEDLPAERRTNLQIIPIAGLVNPDIEIQDLAVNCLETWGDATHVPSLIELRNRTNVGWFKEYITDVIDELGGE
nr:hypothetical protein [uncultured Blautia sp.]